MQPIYHEPHISSFNILSDSWQTAWLRRLWPLWIVFAAWLLTENFGFSVNLTHSLPHKVWLIHLKALPKHGDYVLFEAPSSAKVPKETTVIKQALGIPKDRVTRVGQDFFINDHYVATAKKKSLTGELLIPGPDGVLAEGQYYVSTPHPDSFDSRYQKMGWISQSQIIGVAYPIW